ncbi:ATP-binding protein [Parvularcula sp. LCG005]|uniref:ATP-binding protein n=1 Tax=Parvularcula sp. LCG005 TaxID=3078805 RepID=UPI00294318A5|nr:ATP-binding protein [Parvularcula sp. LCG005]WOI54193.1 response regulator [Parvularcula sp. LCG005]
MAFPWFGRKEEETPPSVDVARVLKNSTAPKAGPPEKPVGATITRVEDKPAPISEDDVPVSFIPEEYTLSSEDNPDKLLLIPEPAANPAPKAAPDPSARLETSGLGKLEQALAKANLKDVNPAAKIDEVLAATTQPAATDIADDDDLILTSPPVEELAPASDPVPVPEAPVEADSAADEKETAFRVPTVERLTPYVVWASLVCVLVSLIYAVSRGGVDMTVAIVFATGIFLFGSLLLIAAATRAYSPILLAGVLLKSRGKEKKHAAVLAGREILTALGLAESILDADVDARMVSSRDGVVVYANDRYVALAAEAGVTSATGLPPRLDRLLSQAGSESSKMFRLARAARSGQPADEVITQIMGSPAPGETAARRRFEVSVRPMRDRGQHVAWRLREVPIENARDSLRAAYADYPRGVIALERSGNLAWINEEAASLLGVRVGADLAVGDFLLGEAKDIVSALWEEDPEEVEARIRSRDRSGAHTGVILTAFGRGGVGEGFVCVEMMPKSALQTEQGGRDLAADVGDAPFGVAVIAGDPGTDAVLSEVNRLFGDAFGAEAGIRLSEALPPVAIRDIVAALRSRAQNQPLTRPVEVSIGEGASASIFRVYARPIKRRRGAYGPRQTVLYAVDVSFQKRMEEDYAHDKRLKAIGKIAGSVAHDFNNFLQAMMGATELLMRRHPAGDPSYPDLVSIRENGQRCRNLTQNLLAFSRKQTLQSEPLSLTDFLADFTPFVQRYVTEKVKVKVNHGRTVPPVKVDKSQLELAIMNLAVNARDAMDKGGELTIESRRVAASEVAEFGYAVLDEIDYALLEVSDSGKGVPEEIADKIFEPFFTTKGEGKGTGLGLSTVHGVIGQMGGRIFLHNRPGQGATFRIFFPALSAEQAAELEKTKAQVKAKPPVDDLTGKGRILIVEDEDSVRNIVVRALAMCGYEIVEACDGDEALEIIEDSPEPFDVVLSDIMMPEMDGPTLIKEAGEALKGAKVIFMSGYAETAMRDKLGTIEGSLYLQKPFSLKKVAATVKEAMGGS